MTGLSGSGKTAFITSLVENLLSAVGRPSQLPFLQAPRDRRLVAVTLQPSPIGGVDRFPLDATIAALAADPPQWPPSTTGLRGQDLSVRFFPSGVLGPDHPIGRMAGGVAELKISRSSTILANGYSICPCWVKALKSGRERLCN